MITRKPLAGACCAVALLATATSAQEWRASAAAGPSPRTAAAVAWDETRARGVLFGGYHFGDDRHFGDTQEFDGAQWTEVAVVGPTPSARRRAAMCFDSRRGVSVLFGGLRANALNTNSTYFDDTWEFDGQRWRVVPISGPRPSARVTDMCFDSSRGVVVLVAGSGSSGAGRDIWEYDGSTWSLRGAELLPRLRPGYEVAFDADRSVTVIQSRFQYGHSGPWETFEWDGRVLQRAHYATPGPNFPDGDLVYDPTGRRIIALGTWYSGQASTWAYDGIDWRELPTGTGQNGLAGHRLMAAASLGSVFSIGGETANGVFLEPTDAVFEFARFAAVTSVGAPCVASGRPVQLHSAPGSLPRTGDSWDLLLEGLVPVDRPILSVGLRDDFWQGTPLPLQLDFVGLPGCRLHSSIDAMLVMRTGSDRVALQVPSAPSLHGVELFAQGLLFSESGVPRGVTGALAGTIGR